jgi:hypothetical protein
LFVDADTGNAYPDLVDLVSSCRDTIDSINPKIEDVNLTDSNEILLDKLALEHENVFELLDKSVSLINLFKFDDKKSFKGKFLRLLADVDNKDAMWLEWVTKMSLFVLLKKGTPANDINSLLGCSQKIPKEKPKTPTFFSVSVVDEIGNCDIFIFNLKDVFLFY